MKRKVLITGITGMDGSHMAELLLEKDYEIFGLVRRSSQKNRNNLIDIEDKIKFIYGDVTDQNSLLRALKVSDPEEVYNFAAQSFVGESWAIPEQTSDVTALGTLRMLEAIREYGKKIKFYNAGSSEMFGKITCDYADENTILQPASPYGVSKLYAHWITKNYRESYDMFNCSGILFNHESPRRGIEFVTRKITYGVARIKYGLQDKIYLGNIEAMRDWGYAPEFMNACWLMMQQSEPDDYVIATGVAYTIKIFLQHAFEIIGITNWEKYVNIDDKYKRPTDIEYLCGNYSKAKNKLGWSPKTGLHKIIQEMVLADCTKIKNEN